MRKRILTSSAEPVQARAEGWLDVERVATVEITSEDKEYPIESALSLGEGWGWRAGAPGPQTIRLIFDEPQKLQYVLLIFEENEVPRTQEFVLRWSTDGGRSFKDIVRQQWNFSPPETKREMEEYRVDLANVTVVELSITPNISGGPSLASLKSMRLS